MIGIIVTGHGNFASGLMSAIKLVAGNPEKIIALDFPQEYSTDDLELDLKQALKDLSECKEDGYLIFTDLPKEKPSKVCYDFAEKYKDTYPIAVVTGVNLGMLLESNIARGYVSDLDALADMAVETGKSQASRLK